jgi:hypothetical protein
MHQSQRCAADTVDVQSAKHRLLRSLVHCERIQIACDVPSSSQTILTTSSVLPYGSADASSFLWASAASSSAIAAFLPSSLILFLAPSTRRTFARSGSSISAQFPILDRVCERTAGKWELHRMGGRGRTPSLATTVGPILSYSDTDAEVVTFSWMVSLSERRGGASSRSVSLGSEGAVESGAEEDMVRRRG